MRGVTRLHQARHRLRIRRYRAMGTCDRLSGTPRLLQPVLFLGPGRIVLHGTVEFGWPTAVLFFSGYCHVEASRPEALIEIGDGAQINNNAFIKSEGAGIAIGPDALIGSGVTIIDSDFHDLHPDRRRTGAPAIAPVVIEENVFVGDGARILKGVHVGAHAVIGAGAVVSRSVPAGAVVAGNPARVVRRLTEVPADGAANVVDLCERGLVVAEVRRPEGR